MSALTPPKSNPLTSKKTLAAGAGVGGAVIVELIEKLSASPLGDGFPWHAIIVIVFIVGEIALDGMSMIANTRLEIARIQSGCSSAASAAATETDTTLDLDQEKEPES